MAVVTLKERIIQEIETLPEPKQEDVLAFIRFLKIGLADIDALEQRFTDALARARATALERGITEQDIDEEIQEARLGR